MALWECTTRDTEETLALGAALGRALRQLEVTALVVSLDGELGSGKTVFVRGLAGGVGVASNARIVSPTFTIARSYAISPGPLLILHHLDAYRLRGPEDLDAIGFEEMWGIGCLTCVEWGGYVEAALPEDRIHMLLQALPPEHFQPGEVPECPRRVRIEGLGPEAARLVAAWKTSFSEQLSR